MFLNNHVLIGTNDNYQFYVAQAQERGSGQALWVGFAQPPPGQTGVLALFAINGSLLGVEERDEAIRRVSAYLSSFDAVNDGYGDVTEWHIPPEQRGNPSLYRCETCEELFCEGACPTNMLIDVSRYH